MFATLYQTQKSKCSDPTKIRQLVLENFGGPVVSGPFAGEWFLPVEMLETDDTLIIKAKMPMKNQEEISVTILNKVLTMRVSKNVEDRVESGQSLAEGEEYTPLRYEIALPTAVLSDYCEAILRDGILFIEVPKAAEISPKVITVTSH